MKAEQNSVCCDAPDHKVTERVFNGDNTLDLTIECKSCHATFAVARAYPVRSSFVVESDGLVVESVAISSTTALGGGRFRHTLTIESKVVAPSKSKGGKS